MGHVWTASAGQGHFGVCDGLVAGAGMYPASDLRRIMPRALMKSADRVPFRFARPWRMAHSGLARSRLDRRSSRHQHLTNR